MQGARLGIQARGMVTGNKRHGLAAAAATTQTTDPLDLLALLSHEILCKIFAHLSLREVVSMQTLCRKLRDAATLFLRVTPSLDLCGGRWWTYMPAGLTDGPLLSLMSHTPALVWCYGLHPYSVNPRRTRVGDTLSIPGITQALQACPRLAGVETSHLQVAEAIWKYLPHVEILGKFRNRNGGFPIPRENTLCVPSGARVQALHLVGVSIPELPSIPSLVSLHLKWVRFTNQQPFINFHCPNLTSFTMSNCAGPTSSPRYVALVTALAAARRLTHLELVRVPFPGGIFQHNVEDNIRSGAFRALECIVFGACKYALEIDLGYLAIASAQSLEEVRMQPYLSKDCVFTALKMAAMSFPQMEELHLGHTDDFHMQTWYTPDELVELGLADVSESPCTLTDLGVNMAGEVFPTLKHLSLYNCPHLHLPQSWVTNLAPWRNLTELTLTKCHAVRLASLAGLVERLSNLMYLTLQDMFRELPRGCARVNLSAGTGIDLLANNNNHHDNRVPAEQPPPPPPPHQLPNFAGAEHVRNVAAAAAAAAPPPRNGRDDDGGGVGGGGGGGDAADDDAAPAAAGAAAARGANDNDDALFAWNMEVAVAAGQGDNAPAPPPAGRRHMVTRRMAQQSGRLFAGASGRGRDGRGLGRSTVTPDCSQVLKLRSSSLLGVTLLACGLSDLSFVSCPRLQFVQASRCPVLCRVSLGAASEGTSRLVVSRCRHMSPVDLMVTALRLPATADRYLCFTILTHMALIEIEKEAFACKRASYLVVLHTFSDIPDVRTNTFVCERMEALAKAHRELLQSQGLSKPANTKPLQNCPKSGKRIFQGKLEGVNYRLATDFPWLQFVKLEDVNPSCAIPEGVREKVLGKLLGRMHFPTHMVVAVLQHGVPAEDD
ncbi:F-box only protein 38 isoform X2 [Petromyzon marinus]|uniref:F-box only protein 38 isoform X2 n=1 Tax=Petromyzon marinus TaxID=7757 RepID=UPI003F6FE79D